MKGKALQLMRCETFKIIKTPQQCPLKSLRKSCLQKLSVIGLRFSFSKNMCSDLTFAAKLTAGHQRFPLCRFLDKGFLNVWILHFWIMEVEDFGQEKWGWAGRRGRLRARRAAGCRPHGGKSRKVQFLKGKREMYIYFAFCSKNKSWFPAHFALVAKQLCV